VTVGKADGIFKESLWGRDDGKWKSVDRVERIELNPDLPDTLFQFTSTPNAEKQ
jgi:hypothetical protein